MLSAACISLKRGRQYQTASSLPESSSCHDMPKLAGCFPQWRPKSSRKQQGTPYDMFSIRVSASGMDLAELALREAELADERVEAAQIHRGGRRDWL
jgi:hypothetical protein